MKDSGGPGFWHETYFLRGGMEAIYDDVPQPIGFTSFAPVVPARGPMFGAAARGGKEFAGPWTQIHRFDWSAVLVLQGNDIQSFKFKGNRCRRYLLYATRGRMK